MSDKLELYLILHKVRGLPAFDIAHQIEMEGEECWIIPTSGHRAYPYRDWSLDLISGPAFYPHQTDYLAQSPPDNWPDHYPTKSSPLEAKADAKSLLASLGLPSLTHNSMSGKLTRRV